MDWLSSLIGGLFNIGTGIASSAMQTNAQIGLNKESYKYNKLLQEQSFGYNKKLQNQSFELSKQLQAYQNAYTTQMASSAHQIEVNDLRKAGLNPILSATGGNGASFSTGGATVGSASVGAGSVGSGNAGMPNFGDAVSAVQAGLNIKQTQKDIELAEHQKDNLDANSYLTRNQANTESEKFNTQTELTRQIRTQIDNSLITTAAQKNYYDSLGAAALIDAGSKRLEATANAYYQTHRALGFTKEESYNNGKHGSFKVFGSGPEGGTTSGYSNRITY